MQETKETQVQSLDQEDTLEKEMTTHSCLENPMDGGAWQAIVHRVAKSQTRLKHASLLNVSPQKITLGLC